MQKLTIQLVDIEGLLPHELTIKKHAEELYEEILCDKEIHTPIIVDKITKVILDGHHRFFVAKKLNLSKIPSIVVDYFDDTIISVFPRRDSIAVTKELVIACAVKGKLFPNKTTKHILHAAYTATAYKLHSLIESVYIKEVPQKGKGVFANRSIKKGEVVVVGKRIEILSQKTKFSFQISRNKHVELDSPASTTNHSCDPNTGVKNNKFGGYSFIALKNIKKDEEVTWDYETTEYESLVWKSLCNCGTQECRKNIRGFKYLSKKKRAKYGKFIADYLKKEL